MNQDQMDILSGGDPLLVPEILKIASMPPVYGEQIIPIAEADAHLRLAGVKKTPEDLIVDTMAELGWSGEQMEALLRLRFPRAFEPNVGDKLGDISSLSDW